MTIDDTQAIQNLTIVEFPGIQRPRSESLPPRPLRPGEILGLETPVEAWSRYVDRCLDELLAYLEKL